MLLNPFQDIERPFLNDEAVRASYQFDVRIGYFRQDDWPLIVERSRPKIRAYYQSNLQAGVWTERTIDELLRRGALDTWPARKLTAGCGRPGSATSLRPSGRLNRYRPDHP